MRWCLRPQLDSQQFVSQHGTCFSTQVATSLQTFTFSWTGTQRETVRVASYGMHLDTCTVYVSSRVSLTHLQTVTWNFLTSATCLQTVTLHFSVTHSQVFSMRVQGT